MTGMGDRTFPVNAARRIPIDRIEELDSDEAVQLVKARRPFVARVKDWGALRCDVSYWKEKLGHKTRQMRRVSNDERITVTINELLDIVQDPGWKSKILPTDFGGPLFRIRRWQGFDPETEALRADVVPPRWMPEPYSCTVLYRNSRLGASDTYYHTPNHWEDSALASLNLQVRGKKHLFLFSPDDAAGMGFESALLEPPYLSVGSDAFMHPDKFPGVKDVPCYETILEPGDIVYWPEFWSHWFIHYPVEQINISFWWEPQDLRLNPISAAWALSNAMANALGGFGDDLVDKLAALSPETRDLLVRMEQSLINSPQLLRPADVMMARMQGGAVLPLDRKVYVAPTKKDD